MVVAPLSERHLEEVRLAVGRALAQWAPSGDAPEQIVDSLERVLLFLRQNGSPSVQARQVTSLALAWGTQIARDAQWRWMSVSEDGAVNPALVSPGGEWACLVVDVVTRMVLRKNGSLRGAFRRICSREISAENVEVVALT